MSFSRVAAILISAGTLSGVVASAQGNSSRSTLSNLTSQQIVERIARHDQIQREHLKHYRSLRHYQAEYKGFATTIFAKMDVEATYDAGAGKSLRIVSQSGSKLLCEKVLKRAVDSELEASRDPGATAMTEANYSFQLEGTGVANNGPAYILTVTPRTASKFLYRGKIWVDATDFAVAKIEAEPARSPSIWIARTSIHHASAKTGDYWLPQQNRSETKVRIGGTAVLTIDYGTYTVAP